MERIEKSIEVNAPRQAVYNQWTQFEEFPKFMEGVKSVEQLDDRRLHWTAEIGGHCKDWEAEIFEQIPDERLAWRSISGTKNSGQVIFAPVDEYRTKVTLTLHYEPEGAIENIAQAIGLVGARVEGDLDRFKKFIEARGTETGGWRGVIEGRHTYPDLRDEELPRSQRIRKSYTI